MLVFPSPIQERKISSIIETNLSQYSGVASIFRHIRSSLSLPIACTGQFTARKVIVLLLNNAHRESTVAQRPQRLPTMRSSPLIQRVNKIEPGTEVERGSRCLKIYESYYFCYYYYTRKRDRSGDGGLENRR